MRKFLFAVCCIAALSLTFAGCSKDGGKKKVNSVESYTVTIAGNPAAGTHTVASVSPLTVTVTATVTNDITGETVQNPVLAWNKSSSTTQTVALMLTSGMQHTVTASFTHNGNTYTSNELVYNVIVSIVIPPIDPPVIIP